MKTQSQALRSVNRIPVTSEPLELGRGTTRHAAHVSAGLQVHHPMGHKRLTSILHFSISKAKEARVVLTIHHGVETKTIVFPFGRTVTGHKTVKLLTRAFKGMGTIHHISIHTYAHRKNTNAGVRLKLIRVDLSS